MITTPDLEFWTEVYRGLVMVLKAVARHKLGKKINIEWVVESVPTETRTPALMHRE